jgi:pre-mRNA-splicing factor 38A
MANTTVRGALAIHGQNPQVCDGLIPLDDISFTLIIQYLVEAVIRNRIYDSLYWKEHCFALTGAVPSKQSPMHLFSAFVAQLKP